MVRALIELDFVRLFGALTCSENGIPVWVSQSIWEHGSFALALETCRLIWVEASFDVREKSGINLGFIAKVAD